MIVDCIEYNDKKYQVSTVNIKGCYETMIFPIINGNIDGNEVYTCRMYTPQESQDEHKNILCHPEEYLSQNAIEEYLKSKEEEFTSNNKIYVVGGFINESGDTDSWVENFFEDEKQAKACCEYLNLTKIQKNVEFNMYELDGFCAEDYVTKLNVLQMLKGESRRKGILTCISKEQLNCLHLTKETRDEVLKELEPRLEKDDNVSIVEDSDKEVVVYHFGWHKAHYYYNSWYVRNYDCEWEHYTDEEFREKFQLIEE